MRSDFPIFLLILIAFAFMLYGSFRLIPLFDDVYGAGWEFDDNLNKKFWNCYDLSRNLAVLCVLKAANFRRNQKTQIVIDVAIVHFWTDASHRLLGITTYEKSDLYIIPLYVFFAFLFSIKHRNFFKSCLIQLKKR